jgi:xanthosine utilization system XapX-like protein
VGFDSWRGQEIFPSVNNVHTGSVAPPASCSVGIVGYFPGVKTAEVGHACLSSTEITNEWSCASAPSSFFYNMQRDSFSFFCTGRKYAQNWSTELYNY